jgi:excisionase family DNA binding protein
MILKGGESMQQYYTISQFARALGITNTTVYRWIESGKIKIVEVAGKKMIPSEELKPKEKEE